jgi:hypothetical protein
MVEDPPKWTLDQLLPVTKLWENNVVEVFGKNPDIDSTALMVYATSWILLKILEIKENGSSNSESFLDLYEESSLLFLGNSKGIKKIETSKLYPLTAKVLNFVIPRMEKATAYLAIRDIDRSCYRNVEAHQLNKYDTRSMTIIICGMTIK